MSEKEIMEYAESNGKAAAYGILLLVGPDGFDGTYDEYLALERDLQGEAQS